MAVMLNTVNIMVFESRPPYHVFVFFPARMCPLSLLNSTLGSDPRPVWYTNLCITITQTLLKIRFSTNSGHWIEHEAWKKKVVTHSSGHLKVVYLHKGRPH